MWWDDTPDNLNAETCWFQGGCVDLPRLSGVLGYKGRTQTSYFVTLSIHYRYSLHVCTLDCWRVKPRFLSIQLCHAVGVCFLITVDVSFMQIVICTNHAVLDCLVPYYSKNIQPEWCNHPEKNLALVDLIAVSCKWCLFVGSSENHHFWRWTAVMFCPVIFQ